MLPAHCRMASIVITIMTAVVHAYINALGTVFSFLIYFLFLSLILSLLPSPPRRPYAGIFLSFVLLRPCKSYVFLLSKYVFLLRILALLIVHRNGLISLRHFYVFCLNFISIFVLFFFVFYFRFLVCLLCVVHPYLHCLLMYFFNTPCVGICSLALLIPSRSFSFCFPSLSHNL